MPSDATIALQALVTKTATFNGAGLNLGQVPFMNDLVVRVLFSAATNASGSNAVLFQIDIAPDGSTWSSAEFAAVDKTINLSTTAQSGEIFIPFRCKLGWIRLTATITGAGSTPTITYQGDITPSWP